MTKESKVLKENPWELFKPYLGPLAQLVWDFKCLNIVWQHFNVPFLGIMEIKGLRSPKFLRKKFEELLCSKRGTRGSNLKPYLKSLGKKKTYKFFLKYHF